MPERVLASVLTVCVQGTSEELVTLRRAFDREVARARGHAVPGEDGAFVALFDGPGRAVRCGTTVVALARTLSLRAGAGVHVGECERDAKDGPLFEMAGALAATASPYEVRVSRTVVDLVPGSGIAFAEGGTIAAAGRAIPVWSVSAEAAGTR
jgi:class 3 adenylate cyclase